MGNAAKKISALLITGAGICMLLYPWISNFLYEREAHSESRTYAARIDETDSEEKEKILNSAAEYNRALLSASVSLKDPFLFKEKDKVADDPYETLLNPYGNGVMCFVEIPKIDVYLPVYHGCSEEALKMGAGHLKYTSLPIGGENTHAVISAHSGMSRSKMFTDLDSMEAGDLFFLHVLDQILVYQVYEIDTVLPEETGSLAVVRGKDLVTLVTCTPYGINTHRLLVRGERSGYTEETASEAAAHVLSLGSEWMRGYKRSLMIGFGAAGSAWVAVKIKKNRRGVGL